MRKADTAPRRRRNRSPRLEAHLVRRIITCIRAGRTPWGSLQYIREFEYGPGRTDLVVHTSREGLIAFEAKLTDWRHAVVQAYRNRAYAELSFVILPQAIAERSQKFAPYFSQYGVGLCTLVKSELQILIPAQHEAPIQAWLAARALATIQGRYATGQHPA